MFRRTGSLTGASSHAGSQPERDGTRTLRRARGGGRSGHPGAHARAARRRSPSARARARPGTGRPPRFRSASAGGWSGARPGDADAWGRDSTGGRLPRGRALAERDERSVAVASPGSAPRDLPLRREGEAADARPSVPRGLADEQVARVGPALEVRGEAATAHVRAVTLAVEVVRLADPRLRQALDERPDPTRARAWPKGPSALPRRHCGFGGTSRTTVAVPSSRNPWMSSTNA